MNLEELNEVIVDGNFNKRKEERNYQDSELIRICNEGYLPSISLEKYESVFKGYHISQQLDYIDKSKDQRFTNYTQFGLDSHQFENRKLEGALSTSMKYRNKIRSFFDNPINSDFFKLVPCYIASFRNKHIKESVDIYDEYRNIKKIFNFLPERVVLEILLYYRDSMNISHIEDKLYSYSKMRESSVGKFFSDSILKNILISTNEGEDILKVSESIQNTVLDISDIYTNAPLYIITACTIYSENPYLAVPHYMSESYSISNGFTN